MVALDPCTLCVYKNASTLNKFLSKTSLFILASNKSTYNPYDSNKKTGILDINIVKSITFNIHQEPLIELDSNHLSVKITIIGSLTPIKSACKLINEKPDGKKIKAIIKDNLKIPHKILNIDMANAAVTHLRETIISTAKNCTSTSHN